jgi:ankyrin repeat protein
VSHTDINTVSESGNVEWLKGKMNAGASADSATDRNDNDRAKMLKNTSEDTLDFQSNPRTALHTAAVNGNLEAVQRLVEAGVALDGGDSLGRTALWFAGKSGQNLIIRVLLQNGTCVNIPDCAGVKPTDIAVREGHWGAVNEFLEHDRDIRPEGTEILTNQLYEASELGELEVVRLILKRCISVNTTNKNSNTSLNVRGCTDKSLARTGTK